MPGRLCSKEDVFMKLLYAEDEESMAEAVTDILVFHKYQVDTVYDGEEALEYARKEITRTLIMLSEEPQQSVKQQNEPPVQPEENFEKLFDRFYRADTARTQKKGGYGIGLSVARAIANAHGGSITAEVTKNQEIDFKVVLPIREKKNKINGLCAKESAILTIYDVMRILDGDIEWKKDRQQMMQHLLMLQI
jgi:signal transduction histidine kinase